MTYSDMTIEQIGQIISSITLDALNDEIMYLEDYGFELEQELKDNIQADLQLPFDTDESYEELIMEAYKSRIKGARDRFNENCDLLKAIEETDRVREFMQIAYCKRKKSH